MGYTYTQSGWSDRLQAFKGEEIGSYDSLGNPWVYRGKAIVWSHGRSLTSYNGNTFTYNASGIRTSKADGNSEATYYLDGTNVIAEERRQTDGKPIDAIYYHYGADGIEGFEYREKTF